jgi:hypothetical protein
VLLTIIKRVTEKAQQRVSEPLTSELTLRVWPDATAAVETRPRPTTGIAQHRSKLPLPANRGPADLCARG